MRAVLIVSVFAFAGPACAPAWAGDNSLLDRFKQKNEQGHDKLKADIKNLLDKAQTLEADSPAKALALLQEERDRLLQKGKLTERQDRALAEPLWERIQALRAVVREQQADELRTALTAYKDYNRQMNEEFFDLRKSLIAPTKEPPPGGPAYIEFLNGKVVVGWLHETPIVVVQATVNDQRFMYAPGLVAGLQTAKGYYLFDQSSKTFLHLSSAEFFLMAVAGDPGARRARFWTPSRALEPPPGFDKRTSGVIGAALFARSAAPLLLAWASPNARRPEIGAQRNNTETARIYRDVIIDLQVQDTFSKLKIEDQTRIRDVIMTFLDRRPLDAPLTPEEIVRLSEAIAESFPDRRADAVSFAHQINRFFEEHRRLRAKG